MRVPRRMTRWHGLAAAVALGTVASLAAAVPASAGPAPGLCHMNTSRGAVPAKFPIEACVDGSNVWLYNTTTLVVQVGTEGDVTSPTTTPTNFTLAVDATRFGHSGEWTLMPGDKMQIPIGSGSAGVKVEVAVSAERYYALANTLATFWPLGQGVDVAESFAEFVTEVSADFTKYANCRAGRNFLGQAGCFARFDANITAAVADLGISLVSHAGHAILNVLLAAKTFIQWAGVQVPQLETFIDPPSIMQAAVSGPAPSSTSTSTPTTGTSPWTAAQPPLPGDADSTSNSVINDVSCPSATSCLATGYYTDTSGVQQGMLLTWSDGAWTAAGKAPYTETLSCVTASLCVAVEGPDIETWSSGTWTITSVPAPADNGSDPVSLQSVSCVSASFCVAAGSYTDTSGSTKGLLETLSDGAWTVEQAPLPADAAANPNVLFLSGPLTNLVSCPSASFCVAAGNYTDTSGSTEGLLETWSDGAWTATKAPLPANAAANPAAAILGVSCPTVSFCLATGDYTSSDNGSESLLETWSGGSWSVTAVQTPAEVLGPVACASTSACVITLIGGSEVLTYSGGSLTTAQLPAPPYGVLWDISNLACASASHCIAVGESSDATNEHWQAVMATGPG